MAVSPAGPVGFFTSQPGVCGSAELPFQGEEEDAEAEAMDGGESEILPEAEASTVEVLGGLAEVDCSGGPLLVEAAWVEALLQVHSEWWCSRR